MAEVICRASLFLGTCRNHRGNKISASQVNFDQERFSCLKLKSQKAVRGDFHGKRIVSGDGKIESFKRNFQSSIKAQTALRIGSVQKWWEKGLQPNMREITSAKDLVDSLCSAGDKLVVVDFYSPGCGGCKALHPKICQLAEMNSDVQFLQVNYEEHKSMCYSLGVHVLPFFRFYRGAHGRLCSFSCTNATIKKFKDALAKHATDRCSLAPTQGLEEKELLALSANKDLNFTFTPKPISQPELVPVGKEVEKEPAISDPIPSLQLPPFPSANPEERANEKTLVTVVR